MVTRDELLRVLSRPAQAFLRQGLDLRLPRPEERLSDDEPFASEEPLQRHALHQAVFTELLATPAMATEDLSERLLARGLVAPGASGAAAVAKAMSALRAAAVQWREWSGDTAERRVFELAIDGTTITGVLAPVHARGLLQLRVGKPHGRHQLALGIDALLWSALGETRPLHRLFAGEGGSAEVVAPISVADATSALRELLGVYRRTLTAPLPFMPKSGFAYAQAIAAGKEEEKAWTSARGEWRPTHRDSFGEGDEPDVELALRGRDPFDDSDGESAQAFRLLSQEIFAAVRATHGH